MRIVRARQFSEEDFYEFDFILCIDERNRSDILDLSLEDSHRKKVHLFLEPVSELKDKNVPDPYHGREDGFKKVFQLVEEGCQAWLEKSSLFAF
jgi:protein-tyrosine phosphatase